jgi:hypothetical protein
MSAIGGVAGTFTLVVCWALPPAGTTSEPGGAVEQFGSQLVTSVSGVPPDALPELFVIVPL